MVLHAGRSHAAPDRGAALYLRPGKRSPPEEADDGRQYYDGNGNHVYYDRRLIARPEKEKEEELQENNH